MSLMAGQNNAAREVAEPLGFSRFTLPTCVDDKGRPKAQAELLLCDSKVSRMGSAAGHGNVPHVVEDR